MKKNFGGNSIHKKIFGIFFLIGILFLGACAKDVYFGKIVAIHNVPEDTFGNSWIKLQDGKELVVYSKDIDLLKIGMVIEWTENEDGTRFADIGSVRIIESK